MIFIFLFRVFGVFRGILGSFAERRTFIFRDNAANALRVDNAFSATGPFLRTVARLGFRTRHYLARV
jgi:hypothetical protein